jgi:hypothetical protein
MPITHILVDFENTQPSAADVALLRGKDQRLWIFRGPGQKKYDAEFAEALMTLGERVGVVKCEKSGRNALDMHIALHIGRLLGALNDAEGAPPSVSFVVVSRDTDYEPLLQYVRAQGYAATRVVSVRAALGGAPTAEKPAATRGTRSRAAAPAAAAKSPAAAAKSPAAAKTRATTAKKAARKTPAAKAARVPARTAAAKSATAAKAPATRSQQSKSTPSVDDLVDQVVERWENPRNRPTRRDRMESWIASHLRKKLPDGDVAPIVAALEKRGIVAFADNRVEYPPWA